MFAPRFNGATLARQIYRSDALPHLCLSIHFFVMFCCYRNYHIHWIIVIPVAGIQGKLPWGLTPTQFSSCQDHYSDPKPPAPTADIVINIEGVPAVPLP